MGPLFHGGLAGLNVGDVLLPGRAHVEDGCPICAARAAGRVFTVRQARAWALSMGPAGDQLLKVLAGAHPDDPVDPPTELQAVYVTTHRLYATWYAARSRGDLYRVEPVGPIERSRTDHFETYTTPAARVLEVLRRGVFLVRRQRRELLREWRRADARVARDRRSFTERAIAAMERELTTG